MFLRKSFQEFLVLHSEADAPPPPRLSEPEEHEPAPPPIRWQIDWRWLEAAEEVP
jgi:hypothetical protein